MINLPIPLQDVDERTIYQKCADAFRDKTALKYIDAAVKSADAYDKYVPQHVDQLPKYHVSIGDDKKIIKVYTEKFAKKDAIGNEYYEAIMVNANGRCPICGGGKLKNLDHYLPKSIYPLLCVTPANLIPTCRDCNMDKKDAFDPQYYALPFNPYFDEMNDVWLKCQICFEQDNTFVVRYTNGYDKSKDPNMWKKYETHLELFDLAQTFQAKALEEIDNCKPQHQKLYRSCGADKLKEALIDCRDSYEQSDKNSWRSALYRELILKLDEYCMWLKY